MSIESTSGSSPTNETQSTDQTTGSQKPADPSKEYVGGIGGLDKFKKEHPEMFEEMLKAMAMEITNKMRKGQENIKKILRESQR